MSRLAAEAKATCVVQFALVQDGLPWPPDHPFELIGRLSTPESFVVLGRNADLIQSVADLHGCASESVPWEAVPKTGSQRVDAVR